MMVSTYIGMVQINTMKYLIILMILLNGEYLTPHFLLPDIWNSTNISVPLITLNVIGTVYWGEEGQTDSTPTITASQKKFNPYNTPRYIALSRDIENNYNLSFGDTIIVLGDSKVSGKWVFEDRMNKRWCDKVDFLMPIGVMGRFNLEIIVPCKTCTVKRYYKI